MNDSHSTTATLPSGSSSTLRDLVLLCRPKHWAKNVFVAAPLLFSESFLDPGALIATAMAVACFCAWSSAVYIFNDVIDAPADRMHPRKRERPVASGRVAPTLAVALSCGLVAAAIILALVRLPAAFLLFGMIYLANNVGYCLVLKNRVIVDVLLIAIGFVLRLLAGCAAISVDPSSWLIVCGFSLALLLGFGKRRTEIVGLGQTGEYRSTLVSYSIPKLDTLLAISASICLLAYMPYTVAPETKQLHETDKLIYTVPFVAYGIFRYIFKVQEGKGDGPVDVLTSDPIFALNAVIWGIAVLVVLSL